MTARRLVHARLARDFAAFPELPIEPLQTSSLSDKDAALAHAIHDIAIRRWLTLRAILDRLMTGELSRQQPEIGAALLTGAAQIVFLDRVPAHAAVDEAVGLVTDQLGPKAGGFVNAVLRRVAEWRHASPVSQTWREGELALLDGRGLRAERGFWSDDPDRRAEELFSLPSKYIAKLRDLHGEEQARALLAASLATPPTTVRVGQADLAEIPALRPHEQPGYAVLVDPAVTPAALLRSHPDLWIQDASAGLAVELVASRRPAAVLDLCAGRGTKTRQLRRTFPDARIIATDTDEGRLEVLRRAFAEDPGTQVVEFAEAEGVEADLILLDVPCTNSGVFARRPEAKYRQSRAQLDRLMKIQRALLRQASGQITPDGVIVYSTCSIEPVENQRMIAWAQEELGLTPIAQHLTWPTGRPGGEPSKYRDGAFASVLAKRVP